MRLPLSGRSTRRSSSVTGIWRSGGPRKVPDASIHICYNLISSYPLTRYCFDCSRRVRKETSSSPVAQQEIHTEPYEAFFTVTFGEIQYLLFSPIVQQQFHIGPCDNRFSKFSTFVLQGRATITHCWTAEGTPAGTWHASSSAAATLSTVAASPQPPPCATASSSRNSSGC